jgi:hypothetical protein
MKTDRSVLFKVELCIAVHHTRVAGHWGHWHSLLKYTVQSRGARMMAETWVKGPCELLVF